MQRTAIRNRRCLCHGTVWENNKASHEQGQKNCSGQPCCCFVGDEAA